MTRTLDLLAAAYRRPASVALGVAALLFSVALVSASPAFAESPWWRLTSGSRPTYVPAGLAENEVQEIVTTPGEVEGAAGTAFELSVAGKEVGLFVTEPQAAELGLPVASSASVQKALEGIYGEGNVTVTGGDSAGTPGALTPLVVTSVGKDAYQPVGKVKVTNAAGGGSAQAKALAVGKPDGEIYVTAENLGDANVDGSKSPVRFTDALPHGLKAVGVAGTKPQVEGDFQEHLPIPCALEESGSRVTCTLSEELPPYDQLEIRIAVVVEGASSGEENETSIAGGGAPSASLKRVITVSGAPVPFGVDSYEMALEEEGGLTPTQAGAHPFQLTTTLTLNQNADTNALENPRGNPEVTPAALTKDLNFKLPPGLIGNPAPFPQCTTAQFFLTVEGNENMCPSRTAVGVALTTVHEPATVGTVTLMEPVFNMEPRVGEPARFGFDVVIANSPVLIDTSVRTGGDYGVTVSVNNITQTGGFLSSKVTFWGVPGDPRHDKQRGWGCLYEARHVTPHAPCNASEEQHPPPFLSMPTSCTSSLQTGVEGDSWAQAGVFQSFPGEFEPTQHLDGCNRLQFSPEIKVAPDGQEASKPTGLTVDVHVPQEVNENAQGLASSNVKNISVTFPEGVVLNPASADGLQACPEDLVGLQPGTGAQGEFLFTPTLPEPLEQGVNFCPDASKVGTVTLKSPLLQPGQFVQGALYLATPAPNGEPGKNPFNTLIAAYIVAKDPVSGFIAKLPGVVTLNRTTGQITSTFENNPQLAFEDAEIHLFGGERAPLATPAHCGTYVTHATFTPWSGTPPVSSNSSFEVKTGPNGGPCPPASLPFAPVLAAGTTNNTAASFSPLTTTISREDGEQFMNSVVLHMPPGLAGVIAGIPRCPEAQANAGTCSLASLIGHTTASVGIGKDPFTVTGGQVFLTEGYEGAPFGLSIVTPAVAGPFNLGNVVVRARIEVDPSTAALTVITDEIPHILKGIRLEIKQVNVMVDRPNFTFNPTNCSPMAVTGTIGAVEGASATVSSRFQVGGCGEIPFRPTLTASVSGHNSKVNGASLKVTVSAKHGEANIRKVNLQIPVSLPSRLTTLQKACTEAQFNRNPAGCPPGSFIGTATAHTPVLTAPLTGPAIIVSHGGASFPDVEFLLQGEGVHVTLDGKTDIKHGITYSKFETVPDEPITSFETTLPQGPHSILGAFVKGKSQYDLCGKKLAIPTNIIGQNGAVIHKSTAVSITGCPKVKTRAQKLKAALKACHKKHNNGKRALCARQARRKYGPPRKK